jgi:alpha-mannosidase
MVKLTLTLSLPALVFGACALAGDSTHRLDLSRESVLYEIGYSHLDTQWRWSYPQVIREYIPNTIHENLPLFEKYPDYIFNWSGANRYRMMQEYYPGDFEKVRGWVARGRWSPAGSSWEENDVNVPSSESLIRQILYGHRYFKKEFGTESQEYMLPDCFGFPASLPSILSHCGLRGFSTQKLSWGSAVGIPFNVGVWEGLNGESVIAALNAGSYVSTVKENLSLSGKWFERLDANGEKSGLYADYRYYGVGDRGGAPTEESVQWVQKSVDSTGAVHVVSGKADQMFRDITDAQKAQLPKYQGDLLLTEHSAGSISSQAYMKRWNHMNEMLASAAEKASVAAALLGATPYPREKLRAAWYLVLGAQFHDILPGTSLPKAYEYSWNDEVIAMNCFASVLENAVGGVSRALDTRVDGVPLVVFNPLSIDREDAVEAEVTLPLGASGVQVCDAGGKPVPTQVLSVSGQKHQLLFLAKVPSIGFAVYAVKSSPASPAPSKLKVSERLLENERYRLTLNDAGDIASILDKPAQRELLAKPARLAFLSETPDQWPAWNMDWKDQSKPPRGYLGGPAKFRIVEKGPVRVAIEVERTAENSSFKQVIRLAAGAASDRIEVANQVDWQSKACALKAEFPLTVSNPLATYNWEVGKIQRTNNDPKKYEVPSHQWFDLTDKSGDYGVSILTAAKYGSDKPDDNTMRLTLIYTPGVPAGKDYAEQKFQDWGRHEFVYAISGHRGNWQSAKSDWKAERFGQPLRAFRTFRHSGKLGRSFSLLRTSSDQVTVRTVKLAEDNDQVIVRLQELNGAPAMGVTLKAPDGFESAVEVNGVETILKPLKTRQKTLALDLKPYQLRSLAVALHAPARLLPPTSQPVALPYNLDVFSFNDAKTDGACDDDGATMPAEMITDTLVSEGITFHIGPRENGKLNAVSCQGQTVELPRGKFNRLYLLALAVHGDTEGRFIVGNQPVTLSIEDWSGFIGSWDNRVFQGRVEELTYSINNPLERIDAGFIKRDPLAWFCSHRHQADGTDQIYTYSYLFKYRLDLPPGARKLTLPVNSRIRVVAVTAAANQNDNTGPAQVLYDDFTGREQVTLRASIHEDPAK